MKHNITACLKAAGWTRDDSPAWTLSECIDYSGCSRLGRWSERGSGFMYCAQHAHAGTSAQDRHQKRLP